MKRTIILNTLCLLVVICIGNAIGQEKVLNEKPYSLGEMKPIDSELKVKSGDVAPDFTLPSVSGKKVTLSNFRGKKNVVLSFVPAAWTSVCSQQWPGYSLIKDVFEEEDSVLLGISVDNIPTLYTWTNEMKDLWFDVLSDFWPHGEVANNYGVLRSNGMAERSLIFVDKKGIIKSIIVMDINKFPNINTCAAELKKFKDK